ncbi:CbaC protein [Natrialbaceae archaeon AArc-T1-2]|uniref:CbaC protein n=1 Tax=Natrialbaceae archaeon AArc-T1-2 TaxID=3053904 RepID=UPI00255AB665|nr:CbaC protein [Natrialbaceae archaeon AArc-T1-2]WIV66875.1 CbaC protein [Natrialbaceae archaeon AArc-T1-2]
MRTSRAKLLILIALVIVVVVELRTVLAFFGIRVSYAAIAGLGVAAIVVLLLWALFPTSASR